jgi:hypothetical protein
MGATVTAAARILLIADEFLTGWLAGRILPWIFPLFKKNPLPTLLVTHSSICCTNSFGEFFIVLELAVINVMLCDWRMTNG